MSHLHFTAIAPLALAWEDLAKLRRNARRLWDRVEIDPALATRVGGEGAPFLDDALFSRFATSTDFAADSAAILRRNHAIWFRVSGFDTQAFDDFRAKHQSGGTLSAHVLLTRSGTLSLIASFDFPRISGTLPFDQSEIRNVFERVFLADASLDLLAAFVRLTVLAPFASHESAPAPLPPRADATHLFTTLIGGTASDIETLKKAHAEEEGSADTLRDASGQSADSVEYVRFGWSYTTLAIPKYTKEFALLPLMVYIQNLWFTQKLLREQTGDFAYDHLGIARERALAVALEALNIERTFAANEVEDFRSNLKPWLAAAFDFVGAKWALADTRDTIERIVTDLRAYYERKLDVYDSRQSKRQASILFWIALIQCTQMFANLSGYFYFLDLSDIDVASVATSGPFILALVVSPVVLTALSIVAAWLYFADNETKS